MYQQSLHSSNSSHLTCVIIVKSLIYQVVLEHQQDQWDRTNQGVQQDLETQRALEVQGW